MSDMSRWCFWSLNPRGETLAMRIFSCDGCGIVLDYDKSKKEKYEFPSMACDHKEFVRCPVCRRRNYCKDIQLKEI